jgi:hypothetical protein
MKRTLWMSVTVGSALAVLAIVGYCVGQPAGSAAVGGDAAPTSPIRADIVASAMGGATQMLCMEDGVYVLSAHKLEKFDRFTLQRIAEVRVGPTPDEVNSLIIQIQKSCPACQRLMAPTSTAGQ